MKVWIVLMEYEPDNSHIVGAYSSEEFAIEEIHNIIDNYPKGRYSDSDFKIYETEVGK